MSEPTTDKINGLIKRTHPEYDGLNTHWQFLEATYRGGRQWFDDNIFQYFKEGSSEYKSRVKRAYRFNHTREVVDLINKYLFRVHADRNTADAPDSVKSFWQNVDGSGMNITEFVQTASRKASIYGCPYVVVDNTQTEVASNASKKDEVGRIYAYLVRPEQVRDLSWGEDGEMNWILIEETVRDDADPFESSGKEIARYRLWTRHEWLLIEAEQDDNREPPAEVYRTSNGSANEVVQQEQNYEITDGGEHNLGFVPVIRVDNVPSDNRWSVPALINDIAYLDRAIANYLSNLDAIIQDQTFSQLAIPAQGLMPGEEGHNKVIEMGTKRVFTYDGEGGAAPFYMSPDPKQAELIIGAIQQIINEIYHSVGLAGERTKQDNSKGIDNSSGVAKAKDFERVNSLLIAKAQAMQSFERQLTRTVAAFAGEEGQLSEDNELVTYPESFDVKGLHDEIDIAMKLSLIEAPAVIRARQLNVVTDKLFRSASKADRAKFKREIDAWRKQVEERNEAMVEQQTAAAKDTKSRLIEEAGRDRSAAGNKQSGTKQRQANRRNESEDQANGRGE